MLKKFIYPKGKVHKNYLKYIGWSCISNIVVSIESVLSTHSMLSVIGKSNTEFILSYNYIGKDLIGQLGGLYYMNKIGNKADKEPKTFIKYSLGIEQTSLLLECVTPFIKPSIFIGVAGVANIGKNICYTGFGAINSRAIQKLALDDNIGEIYAKISILNTIGSSIGMGVGIIIIGIIPDHLTRLGILPILSIIRVYTINKSIDGLL